ncbi:hypothetical protein HUT06_33660 [Actinomadura sp. NAK00032]|uniref:hypothetical protein n=1 Tax=Actinomadura sp. NAK00032 TaxID=2742128 RepID=UPI00158FA863|nr:hypothetical protein [Actinomadura sp. NAK00032]QKW38348.1 hypothetical protein HUT06_33660 [Actinomadura sp. NAK00032]
MTIDAEPLREQRGRKPGPEGGGLVLRLSGGHGPATLKCAIDDEPVPGGWGDWYYRMPPGRHRLTVDGAPPLRLDIDVQPGTVTDIEVQYNESGPAPFSVRLARQPAQALRVHLLPALFVLSIGVVDAVLMGGLILLRRTLA